MLPKSRIWSAVLVGLGLALVVAGLAAPRFLNGDARFPLDLEHSTWTLYDASATVDGDATPLTHQLHMTVQNPASEDHVSLRIGETLRRGDEGNDFDNLVAAATWTYEMDRSSGSIAGPVKLSSVMVMPDAEIEADGVWLKFPTNVEQREYDVFEPTLRRAAPARFDGEATVAGRTVYIFTQDVEPTNLAHEYADMLNTVTAPGPEGAEVQLFRHHAATREFEVDQITGVVVGMRERVRDYYADDSGGSVQPILEYVAAMDDAQKEQIASQLTGVTQSLSRAVTYAVIGIGALLTALGLFGALRPSGRGVAADTRRSGKVPRN